MKNSPLQRYTTILSFNKEMYHVMSSFPEMAHSVLERKFAWIKPSQNIKNIILSTN